MCDPAHSLQTHKEQARELKQQMKTMTPEEKAAAHADLAVRPAHNCIGLILGSYARYNIMPCILISTGQLDVAPRATSRRAVLRPEMSLPAENVSTVRDIFCYGMSYVPTHVPTGREGLSDLRVLRVVQLIAHRSNTCWNAARLENRSLS